MENKNIILMSIQSYFARQIFAKTKKFEFRKSPIKDHDLGKTIYIYSAKEDKAIIGSFVVNKVYSGSLDEILKITGYDKHADKNEIVEYYKNTAVCYALALDNVQLFKNKLTLKDIKKLDSKFMLPQYWRYVSSKSALYNKILQLN